MRDGEKGVYRGGTGRKFTPENKKIEKYLEVLNLYVILQTICFRFQVSFLINQAYDYGKLILLEQL